MSSHSLPAAASRCPVVDGAAFDPLGAPECRDPMPWLRPAQHGAPMFFIGIAAWRPGLQAGEETPRHLPGNVSRIR
jgi:hypothetical protein